MPAENQILEQLEALGRRVESSGAGETPEPVRRVLSKRRFRRRVNAAVIGVSCIAIAAAAGYGIMLSAAGQSDDLLAPGPIAGGPSSDHDGADADQTVATLSAATLSAANATAGAMRQHWAATGDIVTGPSSLASAREPMRAGEHRGPDAVAEWFSGR